MHVIVNVWLLIIMSFTFSFDAEGKASTSSDSAAGTFPWAKRKRTEDNSVEDVQPKTPASWEERWAQSQEPETPQAERLVQYLWHFDMINDRPRNAAFAGAIKCAIEKVKVFLAGKEQVRVLDVGTGSGLLALLAAREGAVCDAIEVESTVVDVARRNVLLNAHAGSVNVLRGHSTARGLRSGAPSVHVLVAELLDTGLLGERFIPALRDARARGWLSTSPPCVIVPARARVYAQLVESAYLRRMCRLDAAPSAFGFARPEEGKRKGGAATGGDDSASAEALSPFDCSLGTLLRTGQARALSPPVLAWEIDFHNLPDETGRTRLLEIEANASGEVDAMAFWWECDLDAAGDFVLDSQPRGSANANADADADANVATHSTPPKSPPPPSTPDATHQDHWLQAWTDLRRGRDAPMVVSTGQRVAVRAHHNDETIWFTLANVGCDSPSAAGVEDGALTVPPPQGIRDAGAKTAHAAHTAQASQARSEQQLGGYSSALRPAARLEDSFDTERVAQLNDAVRTENFRSQIRSSLATLAHRLPARSGGADGDGSNGRAAVNVLHAGDGPLLPLLLGESVRKAETAAAEEEGKGGGGGGGGGGGTAAFSLEGSEECQMLTMRFLAANGLASRVRASSCDPSWLVPGEGSVHLLCAEPYYHSDEFARTWGRSTLLRYWLTCATLRPFLAPRAFLLPSHARVRIAPVECAALWHARAPVRGPVEGVDVTALNSLHSWGKVDAVQLWRHTHRMLAPPVDAIAVDFAASPDEAGLDDEAAEPAVSVTITSSGVCHAIAMWIEYHVREPCSEDGSRREASLWCSTSPHPSRHATPELQGIRYCAAPRHVAIGERLLYRTKVDPPTGVLTAWVVEED